MPVWLTLWHHRGGALYLKLKEAGFTIRRLLGMIPVLVDTATDALSGDIGPKAARIPMQSYQQHVEESGSVSSKF